MLCPAPISEGRRKSPASPPNAVHRRLLPALRSAAALTEILAMRKLLSFLRAHISRILAAIAVCCLILLWAGCTGLKQYRPIDRACDAALSNAECAACSIELTTNYLLGLVEFDDQGWLWS